MAIDRLRDVIDGVASAGSSDQPNASTILKIAALVGVLGMMVVTMGTIFLAMIFGDRGNGEVSLMFGFAGLLAVTLICRYLLRLIPPATAKDKTRSLAATAQTPIAQRRVVTDRQLGEPAVPYQSITEERTRQFEGDR